jgi:integrase
MLAEDDTVSMAVHLLFFTGQRIGDVCDMTWDSVAGGIINITQEKTDKVIFFRLSKRLMAELEKGASPWQDDPYGGEWWPQE